MRRVSPDPDGRAASPVAKCRSCRLRNATWSERLRQQNPRAIAKWDACGWGGQVRRGTFHIPEEFLVFQLLVLCMGTRTQPEAALRGQWAITRSCCTEFEVAGPHHRCRRCSNRRLSAPSGSGVAQDAEQAQVTQHSCYGNGYRSRCTTRTQDPAAGHI